VTDRRRAAVVLATVLLAGCASGAGAPGPGAVPTEPLPTFVRPPAGETFSLSPPPPPVAWADDGETLAVTTGGSSSCPTRPAGVEAVGPHEVRVAVRPLFPDRDPCTADMMLTTSEIEVPDGISADEPLTVVLDLGDGVEERVVLPAAR
jgi:hypothetical protein